MEEEDHKELQLLPSQYHLTSSSPSSSSSHMSSLPPDSSFWCRSMMAEQYGGTPSVDLQLSISLKPIQSPSNCVLSGPVCGLSDMKQDTSSVEALKWQAAEQIRLAAIEKAYAERVRELTRREMEMAQSEFARARNMWQRAREEAEKAERLKETATRQIDSTCMEITCQSCRQRFKP
ncbi:hypothetical protein K2173_027464 [Erythroxylum novogranatense]|uniref:Uncharacterized protein n=1 Tax=Erythroxylum novogranatense TaxID=1862640 RepID=A0AAV8TZ46_9ROSI|nr:hypothetical protein K2173_027464 [Erythroxylum novogranatense]